VNPLLWRGPEFLGFYLGLLAATAIFLVIRRRTLAGAGPGKARLRDPLAIARLRGGPLEVLRVATLGLMDAGAVTCASRRLEVVPGAVAPQDPVGEAVFRAAERGGEAHTFITLPSIVTALAAIEDPLRREGYLPTREALAGFRRTGFILIGLLAVLAVSKLMVAFAGGHHRIFFLLFLAVIGLAVVYAIVDHERERLMTPVGRDRLGQVQALFATLKTSRRFSSLNPEEGAGLGGGVHAARSGLGYLHQQRCVVVHQQFRWWRQQRLRRRRLRRMRRRWW
jgi:uncharacterized protein (TIGR04222 family)